MPILKEVYIPGTQLKILDNDKGVVEFPDMNLENGSVLNAYFEPRLFKWQRSATTNDRFYRADETRNKYWKALTGISSGVASDMYGIGFANVGVIGYKGVTLATDGSQYFFDFTKFVESSELTKYITKEEAASAITNAFTDPTYANFTLNCNGTQIVTYEPTTAKSAELADYFIPVTGSSKLSGSLAWPRLRLNGYWHAYGKMVGCVRVDIRQSPMSSAWHSVVSFGRVPDDVAGPNERILTADTMETVGASYGNAMSLGFCEINEGKSGDYAGFQVYNANLKDNTVTSELIWNYKDQRWYIRGDAFFNDYTTFHGPSVFENDVTFHKGVTFNVSPNFPGGIKTKSFTLKSGSTTLVEFDGASDKTLDLATSFIPKSYIDYSTSYWNRIPMVTNDGVMEVGKYIDLHTASNKSVDFNVRLSANDDGSLTVISKNTSDQTTDSKIYAGSFYESSDERLKENIKTPQKTSKSVEIKEFNFKTSASTKYGVIAQELEKLGLDNLVSTDSDGIKSVDYISLLMLMVKDLREEVEELKKKV